jgi:hypothetical protein
MDDFAWRESGIRVGLREAFGGGIGGVQVTSCRNARAALGVNMTEASSAGSTVLRKLARLGRFIVFLCTAGWVFPHVCTEDMDLTKIQNEQMGKGG